MLNLIHSLPTLRAGSAIRKNRFFRFAVPLVTSACTAVLVATAQPSFAQERKIVVIEDADYFGSDIRTVKDVDLDGCKAVCLGDRQCKAFTFNASAGWCFLKSNFGELQSFPGAFAGRVMEVQPQRADLSADRKAELTFLTHKDLENAETFSRALANAVQPGRQTIGQLRRNGYDALNNGNGAVAEADFRQLLGMEPEDYDGWTQLTTALMMQKPDQWEAQEAKKRDAVHAAVNSYLRAVSDAERAYSLELVGLAQENRYEYRSAIKALRASLALQDIAEVRRRYDGLVAQHGFRIVEHQVDSDSASPRVCLVLSQALPAGADLGAYVSASGEGNLSIETDGSQICAEGVRHGGRYELTARAGLPAADGEKLGKTATISVYVRDRSPSVNFIGRSYVLPAGGDPTIPVISVNTTEVEATVYRIGDRALADVVRSNRFLSQLGNYDAEQIEESQGEKVWSGIVETENRLNEEVTTAIPLSEMDLSLKPGVYVMTARSKLDVKNRWGPQATQWFLVSDLGLSALSGADGVAANVRSLSSAEALSGVTVRLVAVNNTVLGEVASDADGIARFSAGQTRGRGGNAPALIVAESESGDYSFLDLRKPAFDLSDRGVEGRPAPGPLDVFAWTDRGVYKAGETVHAQALLRTAKATAQPGLPLTFVFSRPDGVEHARYVVDDGGLGGHLQDLELAGSAHQGIWTLEVFLDAKASPLARETFLVEDYKPERVDFELNTRAASFERDQSTPVSLEARFLYGSPAGGQTLEGDIIVSPTRELSTYPGYLFGLVEGGRYPERGGLPGGLKTGLDGKLEFSVDLPPLQETTALYSAELVTRLVEAGGRYVERTLSLPVALDGPRIGIKPAFEGGVDEGGPADFSVIAVDDNGNTIAADNLSWALSKVDRRYQWYRANGRWSFEPVTTTKRVSSGELSVSAERPAELSVPVEWGEYRLEIVGDGDLQAAASYTFNAGWYTADATSDTPDYLDVGLDKTSYRPGDTAVLRLKPQMDGIAVVNVVAGGLSASQMVDVSGETEVSIPVSDDWGAGAYVTASLYRPMDLNEDRMPARAVGLSWLQVDPGDRAIQVAIDAPERIEPQTTLNVPVRLENLAPGEQAYLTVAAVDVGILNLTGFETPDPEGWYFGQRRLEADMRDLYGQLIDRTAGVRGRVRSGGDAAAMRMDAPPPEEEPVALFSGLVEVGANGEATVSFDVPDFNGSLRLMAVAWSENGVGHGEQDVEVRNPLVISTSAPAFLSAGDTSRLLYSIDNVDGPAGDYELTVSASGGLSIDGTNAVTRVVALEEGGKADILLPVVAGDDLGRIEIVAALSGPEGLAVTKRSGLDIKDMQPFSVRNSSFQLAAGGTLSLSDASFDGLRTDTVKVTVTAGGAARIDVAGLLSALDRYPFGCTEQTTSRALPLLYLGEVAQAAGLGTDDAVRERIQDAIGRILANQSSSGAFGLWNNFGGAETWLDAYVTDFLTRAREQGYRVPDVAFSSALDNLENRLAYASDFDSGGEDIAYSLYVLARNGRASTGDLRYYLDAKLSSFATPLAKAQVAASLALYGERERAATGFGAALGDLPRGSGNGYRTDFGSNLRDSAAVANYVVAASMGDGLEDQAVRALASAQEWAGNRSTQDMAWLLMAARELNKSAEEISLEVNGSAASGGLVWSFDGEDLASVPAEIGNSGTESADLLVSVSGQPLAPEPAGGYDYAIERTLYDLDGNAVDPFAVPVNTRIAVVVTVRSLSEQPGRLMIVDRVPAGLAIDNPRLVRSGDLGGLEFLSMVQQVEHTAFYGDRFEVAVDQTREGSEELTFAYLARAVTPGDYAHPPASVEDMYRPERRAITGSGRFTVLGPTR